MLQRMAVSLLSASLKTGKPGPSEVAVFKNSYTRNNSGIFQWTYALIKPLLH